MRRIVGIAVAASLLALSAAAAAQLSFPTSPEDYPEYYVTAYFDHGGVTDWNCGSNSYSGHGGSDFGGGSWAGMAEGRDVLAAAAGTVTDTYDGADDECSTGDCGGGGGYGNHVEIQMADGNYAIYGHMTTWSVAVAIGDVVECGDFLGLMGSSGNSTGPHLHFDIRDAGWTHSDPFAGDCSDTPASMWAVQGAYEGLPEIACGEPADCEPIALLTCGDVVTSSNDAAGSTTGNYAYGCDTGFVYSGPETAYSFATDLDEPVNVTLTGLTADLDLYAVAGTACDGDDCIAASSSSETSDEALAFDATAGVEVVLVMDGWEGAMSGYTLTVECEGGAPDADSDSDGDADAGADSGADSDADADGGSDSDGDSDGDSDTDEGQGGSADSGCGCRAVDAGASGLLGMIFF
jgi:murein DD-endopeptidase MepM/ murein hydrolase activator NlpD